MPAGPTVTNCSCLIVLATIGQLPWLKQLYGKIAIPTAVAQECGLAILTPWMQVQTVQNVCLVQTLRNELGAGEAEAIALAVECSAARFILGDKEARRVARQFTVPLSGTLAVVVSAKEQRFIPAVRPVFDQFLAVGFRISNPLLQVALEAAGE